MADNVLKDLSELPFFKCDYDTITEMFETPKNCVLERLNQLIFVKHDKTCKWVF